MNRNNFPNRRIALYGQSVNDNQRTSQTTPNDINIVKGGRVWKLPVHTFSDLLRLGVAFAQGRIGSTPWHAAPLVENSAAGSDVLARINAAGFLTINGQPGSETRYFSKYTNKFWHRQQKPYLDGYVSNDCFSRMQALLDKHQSLKYQAFTFRTGRYTANVMSSTVVTRSRGSSVEANVDSKPWEAETNSHRLEASHTYGRDSDLRLLQDVNPEGARILWEQCTYLTVLMDDWGSQELEPFVLKALQGCR